MKLGLAGFALAASLAAAPCTLPRMVGSRNYPATLEGRFCAPAALPIRQGSAQVLFDDSGSMKGFQPYVSQIHLWSEQALSQVRQWGAEWTRTRGCFFSTARAVGRCSEPRLRPAAFQGAAGTTLNAAIESATNYDLTLIVTDGAGASGDARGDCAGGVDAACVARALARALAPRPGQPQGAQGGVWIVPLVALYDGPLYTEQPIAPGEVNEAAISAAVSAATSTTAVIAKPRSSSGLLVYDYTGPRTLLAVVIARNASVGRAFVAALYARMAFAQVQPLSSLKQFQKGLAALRAIEVFPGAVPGVEWGRASVMEPTCLTLDARLLAPNRLAAACSNRADEAVVRLQARAEPASRDCVTLAMLPVLGADFRPAGTLGAIRDYAWSGTPGEAAKPLTLSLKLLCSRDWRLRSGQCEPAGVWLLRRDYAASAAALVSGPANRPAVALVRALSSPEVATKPHLVFQLQETIEKFYRNALTLAPAGQAPEITHLDLCRQ